jgi:hypothetical protein
MLTTLAYIMPIERDKVICFFFVDIPANSLKAANYSNAAVVRPRQQPKR